MKILGLIPARGGSKGIRHKNIYEVGGKPLIAYTIEEALKAKECGSICDVVVTTDDSDIAEVSKKLGASVPFLRPAEISKDTSKSVDCMIHAFKFFRDQGILYDAIMLLQPTSPLRIADDIIKSAEAYENGNCDSLISCYLEESISEYNSYHIRNGETVPLNVNHNKGKRRQDIEPLFVRNGAIFITDVNFMLETQLVIGEKPLIFIMPRERSANIDTYYDMQEAEWVLSRR